jgi:hypothetical protein
MDMTEYYGNLALQRKRASTSGKRARVTPILKQPAAPIKAKRIPVTATPAPEMTSKANAHAIRHSLAVQRLKILVAAVFIVLTVAGIFSLVVYRQAQILELNFNNLSVERQIVKLDQSSSQIREALAQKTNLDLIRQQAISRLGLQDPAGSQIVNVNMPGTDRVVFHASEPVNVDQETYLAVVFSTLEGYFKNMNQQRTGD